MLKEGVAQAQSANGLRLELAQLLEATSDVDGAIEQYDILNSGDNPPAFAANNLAMLLVTYKEDEASLEKAARVAEVLRGTTNPRYLDTLGWVYFKRNQVISPCRLFVRPQSGHPKLPRSTITSRWPIMPRTMLNRR